MTDFTPWASAAGGALIGLAAVLLMLSHGRIFGATGIVSGAVFSDRRAWRWAVLFGMLLGPLLVLGWTQDWPSMTATASGPLL